MSGPKRSPIEKTATATSATDQGRSVASEDKAQGTLNQFEGPVQDSPFYKSLLTSGTEATSNAYNAATASERARANAAGINYTQPAEQGAENELRGSEATALGDLPGEAAVAATAPTLTAAGDTAGIGATEGSLGAQYFTGGAVPLENAYQNAQSQFTNALLGIPGQVIGGTGGIIKGLNL
jgi:hypothetical protein